MPVVPRAASASPSEAASRGARAWRKHQRLLRPPEFARHSHAPALWRAARRWIAMSAHLQPASAPRSREAWPLQASPVRFGITVARHQAARAVDRNGVKRILREAARSAGEALLTAVPGHRVDIVLRLKARLPDRTQAPWSKLKAELRREADSLLAQLQQQVATRSSGLAQALAADCAGVST
ncbi:MAG TPA: ribonuclease P protein component [Burkholderiaceae bacterium]|nr:ribonuclease P protein component [Burkholderiaceae bacterium]